MFTSEEQQSTNQNKKNKKKFGEKNKTAQKMIPICGQRKNSEVKISHAEKNMKNLPTILDSERISYPENYERNRKIENKGILCKKQCQKKKCPSNMSREKTGVLLQWYMIIEYVHF